MVSFGEFAKARGASKVEDLPNHVEPFVQAWIGDHAGGDARPGDVNRSAIKYATPSARGADRTSMGRCLLDPPYHSVRRVFPSAAGRMAFFGSAES
jgi:hypothetical protein